VTASAPEWTGRTQNANIRLDITSCVTCGTAFGIEATLHDKLRETGRRFYCPNGHDMVYAKTRVQELEEDLAREKRWHNETEHRRQLTKGALTRLSNRIAFGVCPCCHRHFDDVQRHMATKHPDFLKSQSKTGEPIDYTSTEKLLAVPIEEMVYLAIRNRKLAAVQIRGRFRVPKEALEQWKVGSRYRR
jgi:hypothetical protein